MAGVTEIKAAGEKRQYHSFSTPLAERKEIGLRGAILLQFLAYWIGRSNHQREGRRWYYATLTELAGRFPYFSRSGLDATLKKLEQAKLLLVGNFNRRAGDRTQWYALRDTALMKAAMENLRYFSVEDAATYGLTEALLLSNIAYWVGRNRVANPGYTWHPVSAPTLAEVFPVSARTINRALAGLVGAELEVRTRPGWDQREEYRLLNESRIQTSHLPERNMHPTERNTHAPKQDMHTTNLDIHAPNPDSITYKKILNEDSKDAHVRTARRTASSACVSKSSAQTAGVQDMAPEQELVCPISGGAGHRAGPSFTEVQGVDPFMVLILPAGSSSAVAEHPAASVQAGTPAQSGLFAELCSVNATLLSGLVNLPKPFKNLVRRQILDVIHGMPPAALQELLRTPQDDVLLSGVSAACDASPWPHSLGEDTRQVLTGLLKETCVRSFRRAADESYQPCDAIAYQGCLAIMRQLAPILKAEHQARREQVRADRETQFASPDREREGRDDLSAQEKVVVLNNGILERNRLGYEDGSGRTQTQMLKAPSKSIKAAEIFFEANPGWSAGTLLEVLDYCAVRKLKEPLNGDYDEARFQLDRGTHLTYLLGNLEQMMGHFNMAEFLPPVDFVPKEKLFL